MKNSWASWAKVVTSGGALDHHFSIEIHYLLLIAGEVVGVGPDHVEQLVGGEGGLQPREELLQVLG